MDTNISLLISGILASLVASKYALVAPILTAIACLNNYINYIWKSSDEIAISKPKANKLL